MPTTRFSPASLAIACALLGTSAYAIDAQYARKLERSGCTQVTETQGCDIRKTKEENARAGFGTPTAAIAAERSKSYMDMVGTNAATATETMASRGFKNVAMIEGGSPAFAIYYRPRNRLCVQLTVAEGKVILAEELKKFSKCR